MFHSSQQSSLMLFSKKISEFSFSFKLRISRHPRPGPLGALTIALTTIRAYNQKMPRNAPANNDYYTLESLSQF